MYGKGLQMHATAISSWESPCPVCLLLVAQMNLLRSTLSNVLCEMIAQQQH